MKLKEVKNMNFYLKLNENLCNIKPKILQILKERKIIVRKKENDDFQVFWEDNSEKPYIQIISDLKFVLDDYIEFQNSIGRDIYDLLSPSEERKYKSILNLVRKDIWFDPNVHSQYKKEDNKFYCYYRGNIQEKFFAETNLDKAKERMIRNCRNELIDSFQLKFDSILVYLDNEFKRLDIIINQMVKNSDKASKIYNYGLKILEDDSTIAMILLGVSLECHLKMNYNADILEKDSLGKLIGRLKESKKYPNLNYKLINEINIKYIKAKHEKTAVIPYLDVEKYYQKATIFFQH